jgi:DNA repair protein RadD
MKLREYQQRAIDDLYKWFNEKNKGNPCLVLPTGSGKSHIVAALCKDALHSWPETRVLMLTHVKELISQNAEKMMQHWPGAPLGIYSSSLRMKQLGEPITFAGIQSVRNKAEQIGHIDLVIIDECFVKGTQISTPNGYIDIDKVRCGDIVYNQCGVGVVEATSCKTTNDLYKLELSNGKTIQCTENHKFFTNRGWVEAKALENGEDLFSIESMRSLWKQVQTLDKDCRWEDKISSTRTSLEQAKFLLNKVCKEITSDCIDITSKTKDKQEAKGIETQAYKSWRERAIAIFATISITSRIGRWLDCGVSNKDTCRASKWNISELLQSRYRESKAYDSNRIGWWKSRNYSFSRKRFKENRISNKIRLVSVSCEKRESPTLVFNIQVSGHPSYFANDVAVHNCHLVSHKNEGGYRLLLSELLAINPLLRVIGLTATPYRLGHGLITDEPALFDELINPVSIEQLIEQGFLSPLRSKITSIKLDTSQVHKRGGEFIESELHAAVDNDQTNQEVVQEVIKLAQDRKAWLFFCSGVEHAFHIRDILIDNGVIAECITGETKQKERAQIIEDFKTGKIQALTNANVLTTGFDYPDIDLIAMLRPTMSASLYVQMAGRGMRPKSHTDHCLVLDFAGVVEAHGPITNITPPNKKGEGTGEAPVKICDECGEIVYISVTVCPACGEPFPLPEKPKLSLRDDDIMGIEGTEIEVTSWIWRKHISKASGKEMLAVTYYGALSDPPVTEYLCVTHDGYAGSKARQLLQEIFFKSGTYNDDFSSLDYIAIDLQELGQHPSSIEFIREGRFNKVLTRSWSDV